MKLTVSLFILIAVLGISAKQQVSITEIPKLQSTETITKNSCLLKPSEDLLAALKDIEYKSILHNESVSNILKSKKDTLSLINNKE